jgi:hypothetical protein
MKPSEGLTGHKSTIDIDKLDDVVIEKAIQSIRMMNIDVEGWELEVLKGSRNLLSRSDAPILCIECSKLHPVQGGTTENIYTFVTEINRYQVYRLSRGKERISKLIEIETIDDLPKHDNIFCLMPHHKERLDKSLFLNHNQSCRS